MLENYGEEIACGELGPGRLATIDMSLYMSVRANLLGGQPPMSIEEFFNSQRDEAKRVTRSARRYHACAELLGTKDADAAARFFGCLRPVRVNWQAKGAQGGAARG